MIFLIWILKKEKKSRSPSNDKNIVVQDSASYKENLETLKPDFVVHGDDWQYNYQKNIVMKSYKY